MNTPFKVTFKMATPMVVGDHDTFLDALIAWCMVKESNPKTDQEMADAHANLPFEKHFADDGSWVWKASKLIKNHGEIETRYFTRRFGLEDVSKKFNQKKIKLGKEGHVKLNASSGQYKAFLERYHLEIVDEIVCYGVGDVERIAELLMHLDYIGAKTRLCHGRIATDGITIERISEDECLWSLRPLPVSHSDEQKEGYYKRVYNLHPPYWKSNNKSLVFYPKN